MVKTSHKDNSSQLKSFSAFPTYKTKLDDFYEQMTRSFIRFHLMKPVSFKDSNEKVLHRQILKYTRILVRYILSRYLIKTH